MGKRDELIAKYVDDLKNKCKVTPDMALLTKVVYQHRDPAGTLGA